MLKILCGCVIVFGFGYGGFLYSEGFKKELKSLSDFCDALSMLEFSIRYKSTPIREAFFGAGKSCGGAVGKVFIRSADILGGERGASPKEAFCRAVDENLRSLSLSNDEIDILKSFAKTLGEGDREAEINNIMTAKLRLSSAIDDSKEDVLKKVKMSRTMGFLLGLFIVIVLI